jgi:membrane associated rhomboid family serine protease
VGILTSIFVHGGGLDHLIGNMVNLFICLSMLAVSNFLASQNEREQRSAYFLFSMFFAAILSNFLFMILFPHYSSTGASGVVYAVVGILFVFSFVNCFEIGERMKKTEKENVLSAITFLCINVFIFSVMFIQIILDPAAFLSVAPGVNKFTHCTSFFAGLFLALLWFLKKYLAKKSTFEVELKQACASYCTTSSCLDYP